MVSFYKFMTGIIITDLFTAVIGEFRIFKLTDLILLVKFTARSQIGDCVVQIVHASV